ncbi:hypothetical protein ABEV41_00185 [Geobacillus thermodenitrificans]|jgi:hypothetical protein|uniref:hypothetical protein n=1 Tax=Geobacillus thermodenitrificans TaxID=33940 RepID=UPI003D1A829D
MKLNHILGKSQLVEGVGYIYPIRLKDWDEFVANANVLLITKKHFHTDEDIPLLDLLVFGLQSEEVIGNLEIVFKLALRVEQVSFVYDDERYGFIANEDSIIHSQNYEEVRRIIMEQNLLFEPKVYKDPLMQKWAEKVLEARRKNAPNITLEDKISTVAALTGKHYWDLENYTIYQLEMEFARLCAIKSYESQSHLYARDYTNPADVKLDHFAEKIDMFKNPYDDLFKSKDKFKNINKAIKG